MLNELFSLKFILSLIFIISLVLIPFFIWHIRKNINNCDFKIKDSIRIIKTLYLDRKRKILIFEYSKHEYLILLSDNHGFLIDKISKE